LPRKTEGFSGLTANAHDAIAIHASRESKLQAPKQDAVAAEIHNGPAPKPMLRSSSNNRSPKRIPARALLEPPPPEQAAVERLPPVVGQAPLSRPAAEVAKRFAVAEPPAPAAPPALAQPHAERSKPPEHWSALKQCQAQRRPVAADR